MTDQLDADAEQALLGQRTAGERAIARSDPAADVAKAGSRSGQRKRARIWSNLNLNGPVPARVRPAIGEWGPSGLPSTKHKKRARWIAPVAFCVAVCALVLLGWYFWLAFR